MKTRHPASNPPVLYLHTSALSVATCPELSLARQGAKEAAPWLGNCWRRKGRQVLSPANKAEPSFKWHFQACGEGDWWVAEGG